MWSNTDLLLRRHMCNCRKKGSDQLGKHRGASETLKRTDHLAILQEFGDFLAKYTHNITSFPRMRINSASRSIEVLKLNTEYLEFTIVVAQG